MVEWRPDRAAPRLEQNAFELRVLLPSASRVARHSRCVVQASANVRGAGLNSCASRVEESTACFAGASGPVVDVCRAIPGAGCPPKRLLVDPRPHVYGCWPTLPTTRKSSSESTLAHATLTTARVRVAWARERPYAERASTRKESWWGAALAASLGSRGRRGLLRMLWL